MPVRSRICARGSFSRHLRQMISRLRGCARLIFDGGSGGRSRTWSMISAADAPRNGARRVENGVQDRPRDRKRPSKSLPPRGARCLLRRHERGRADDRTRLGQLAVPLDPLRQAEIGHIRLASLVQQDVRWLQIPVQDPARWAWCTASAAVLTSRAAALGSAA